MRPIQGPYRTLLLALTLLLPAPGAAQPLTRNEVPETLRDWIPWVLDEARDRGCPRVQTQAICLWPGRLALELSEDGGRFTLAVHADRDIDVPLPGGIKSWPQDVRLDGRAAVLGDAGDKPSVRVSRGEHRVDGRFVWPRLPESLALPETIGLLDLRVHGRRVSFPRREPGGLLLLRAGGGPAARGDDVQVKVFRRLSDGIPLWLETRLLLDVSGKARELLLEGGLIEGAVPVALRGALPARLDTDGRLRVQVRAGTFTVELLALLQGRPLSLTRTSGAPHWPAEEVWVFAADERLRQVQLSGPPPVDPSRTDLPDEWRQLPAFNMPDGATLTLEVLRRGEPDATRNQLQLQRTFWLDESGAAFTARDAFTGHLGAAGRLNLQPPGELGQVLVDGSGQIITADPQDGAAGVELRAVQVSLQADSRWPRSGALAAVGWDTEVGKLQAWLHLPPGWTLLAALGVDQAPGSWIAAWDLFAFFFVLLTTIVTGKLFGRGWALLVLLLLGLLHGQPGAPRWVWLSLLGALALRDVAPQGLPRKIAWAWLAASLLILALALPGFLVWQVRDGLFPQVGQPEASSARGRVATPAAVAPQAADEAPAPAQAPEPKRALELPMLGSRVDSVQEDAYQKAYRQDPHAVIQTGSGVPSWSWHRQRLAWSGPVASDHGMRLILLSPGANLLLALLRVLLTLLLVIRIAVGTSPHLAGRLRTWPLATRLLGLVLALLVSAPAEAQDRAAAPDTNVVPHARLLAELRARLTRAPACAPDCVTTARAHLAVRGQELSVEAEVHAAAASAWPLPGPAESWVPIAATVDGERATLARLPDGFLHLRLKPGVHRVKLVGPLPPGDSLTLQFREPPRYATAFAPGWQVDGIREDGSAGSSVQLSRQLNVQTSGGSPPGDGADHAPWLQVTRELNVGLSWNVETVVRRISPAGRPLVVKVPLLEGMLVTDSLHQVQDGDVLVTLGRDQVAARWSATLPTGEARTLRLEAPEDRPWSEIWKVNCGPVWQCQASGLPPVSRRTEGRLATEFRPWPGESLTLSLRRPAGVRGPTMTIERAALTLAPGARLEDASLRLDVRTSRRGALTLTLPEGAQVQALAVGGVQRPIRPDENRLRLNVEQGTQAVLVTWRRSGHLGVLHQAAPVVLDQPAVNAEVSIKLPPSRWLIFTGGPSWGPAVLFWGYLLVVLVAALAAARVPGQPLTVWDWALLSLGLAQISTFGALLVAGWFFVLVWRHDRTLAGAVWHNLMQLALVLWTLAALVFLYAAVHDGLLVRPDMHVAGAGSHQGLLRWYTDRVAGPLPQPWVLSLPLWVYRVAMLAWSLWLALRLARWIPWGWSRFNSGALWRSVGRPRTGALVRTGERNPPVA